MANGLYASLPGTGFELTDREEHWARFAHFVDGKARAIVVLHDEGPEITTGIWSVVALVACDAAEFAPGTGFTGGLLAVWLDGDSERVPTTIIHEIRGPGHCGWESTIWLRVEGELFLRDPNGVLREAAVGPFDPDAVLPTAAISTGYHERGRTIWRDGDVDSILVVTEDHVERWPRAIDPYMGCA